MKIELPNAQGAHETYHLQGKPIAIRKPRTPFKRVAFAAAHVVANPFAAMPILQARPPSTGTRPWPTAATCSISALALPRPWILRSVAWDWTGRARWS